jgi:hypothetical protein
MEDWMFGSRRFEGRLTQLIRLKLERGVTVSNFNRAQSSFNPKEIPRSKFRKRVEYRSIGPGLRWCLVSLICIRKLSPIIKIIMIRSDQEARTRAGRPRRFDKARKILINISREERRKIILSSFINY